MSVPATAFALRDVTRRNTDRIVLDGVNLDIPAGAVTAIVGPSGSGKTSLVRLLNRLDDPTSGTIVFENHPLPKIPIRTLRQRVGFVFQTPIMFPGTVTDNVREGARLAHRDCPDDRLRELLDDVGLRDGYATRDAQQLSGGERQRVSIARALATEPAVLLMDEPTSALDREVAERLMNTVADLSARKGMTIVMITHRLEEARRSSTFTVMLDQGKVIESGPTARVFDAPETERARAYFGRDDA